jgi:hypothetical protein
MRGIRTRAGIPALLLVAGCGFGAQTLTPVEPAEVSGPAASASPSSPTPAASSSRGPAGTPAPTTAGTPAPTTRTDSRPVRRQLPRGGTAIFPRHRLVGYAGLTGSPALGRLGIGRVADRVDELEQRAAPYADGKEVLPVLEVIATIVQSEPGRDGLYRARISDAKLRPYLRQARAHKALLLLNIQPGRARFIDEVKAYDDWLAEPDVGLALDPEWAMGPGQVPGRVFGHTTGEVVDEVAAHVARIVARNHLPEKVVVYHQLAPRIVRGESRLKRHRGVVLVKSVDGIGTRQQKLHTYRRVNASTPKFVHPGFKLFLEEDSRSGSLMTPRQVLMIKPKPDYIMYE